MGAGVPRFWSGHITAADLDPSLIAPLSSLTPGGIQPDALGLLVWNATGSPLTAGTLVYVSGWNAANTKFQVSKASASGQTTAATYVVLADIANGASGTVGKHFAFTSQNTNAATVGDAVYLGTTAGGYTLTSGPANAIINQIVGRVSVKSATVGVVQFDLQSMSEPVAIDTIAMAFPDITTTVAKDRAVRVRYPGSVAGASFLAKDVLATSDSNYITWTLTNKGGAGAGSTALLATSPAGANTTKVTGGTAIAAWTPYIFALSSTPADLVVALGDVLLLTATQTGTLANQVTEGSFDVVIIPS